MVIELMSLLYLIYLLQTVYGPYHTTESRVIWEFFSISLSPPRGNTTLPGWRRWPELRDRVPKPPEKLQETISVGVMTQTPSVGS
jgi:hypothetical protein